MKISELTQRKTGSVVTAAPHTTISDLLALLAEYNIGAVVVTDSSGELVGIVTERDVVRRLNSDGVAVLDRPINSIMTAEVVTCSPDDEIAEIAARMTHRRVRHMPVLVDGQLVQIVSIGDIVKTRIDQLTAERDLLESYIHQ